MLRKDLSIQDVRKAVKILKEAEDEFKKKLYDHDIHFKEQSYWALAGCDDCYYELIKNKYEKGEVEN